MANKKKKTKKVSEFEAFMRRAFDKPAVTEEGLARKDDATALADLEAEIEKERLSKRPNVAKGGSVKKYARGGGVRKART